MRAKKIEQKVYIKPRSTNQQRYLQAIENNDITICTGLPGAGKTFLAIFQALKMYQEHKIHKIILTRPIVEAGENLGFLPGPPEIKAGPYIRPMIDCLGHFINSKEIKKLQDNGIIEIEPLAYMKGRTFDRSFMILDEAQNATIRQIEMFLTRIGDNSKIVISGDTDQSDIKNNGLNLAAQALNGMKGVDIIQFGPEDVVRHPMIAEIIRRFAIAKRPSNGHGLAPRFGKLLELQ